MWSNVCSPLKSLKQEKQEAPHLNQEEASEFSNSDNKIQADGSPLMRYKHAVCSAPTGFIYIHGGRFGNLPLDDDVWRFDPHQNSWLQLETKGERPPSLQEHTLVEHDERLYLFGGQVSAANCDSSFWQLDLLSSEWRSLARQSSKLGAHLGPTNRRGHSAVVYRDSMYIFGGFEDFRGSSAQLWEFDLLNPRWELRNLSASSACHPEARHSHSAIVYGDSMFVYGGLSNLKPLGDLWRWSWRDKRWFKERTRGRSPGQLHGHTAIQAFGSMFVFGGERNGRPTRSLWRLNLTNLTWQKVRSKGPRPDPTTWHGAIANPLSILDEANYIIEGGCAYQDEELLKAGGSLGDSSCPNVASFAADQQQALNNADAQEQLNRPQADVKPTLSHSKSLISATVAATQLPERPAKRKSRLGGFLRRSRQDRNLRSNYELMKQQQQQQLVCNSASAVASLAVKATDTDTAAAIGSQEHVPNIDETMQLFGHEQEASDETKNIKVLDSLDTDIKKMFQRALSPDKMMTQTDGEEELEPMAVDAACSAQEASANKISRSSIVTSRSQYQTAIAAGPPDMSQTASTYRTGSQRTSYAYTTPPSELNTLTLDTPAACNGQQQRLALLASRTPVHSGYDRRNNRPKSEIVQSLIERADARIKHLYTPYFNHAQQNDHSSRQIHRHSGGGNRSSAGDQQQHHAHGSHRRNNRHSFSDKSKRHTIHQTMTYYNLYFSEDKSSSSTQSDASGATQAREDEPGNEESQDRVLQPQQQHRLNRMVRDDLSSSTIRGGLVTPGSSGALVGVHGGSPHVDLHQHQSQLSLEANSSDSRTLCGDLSLTCTNNGLHSNASHHQENCSAELFASSGSSSDTMANTSNSQLQSSSGGQSQTILSLQSALTARRDTGESCDNTSLSFSVIAEFEEDDMLQYSSPTDPVIMRNPPHAQQQDQLSPASSEARQPYRNVERDNQGHGDEEREDEYELEDDDELQANDIRLQQQDIARKQAAAASAVERLTELAELHSSSGAANLDESQHQYQHQKRQQQQQLQAHKSASSGYDSISGFGEHSSRSRTDSQHGQSEHSPGGDYSGGRGAINDGKQQQSSAPTADCSHEDSSVRTESSLGFTETSPEQSMHKRIRGRQLVEYDQNRNHRTNGGATVSSSMEDNQMSPKLTASSTTADSLALASSHDDGGFEPPSLAIKSLPSSPPSGQQRQLIGANAAAAQRERKLPLVSRAKFLGKRKSKNRYWQLCMFVIGGKQGGVHGINEPITIWRLYI